MGRKFIQLMTVLLLSVLANAYAQEMPKASDEDQIRQVVQQYFEASRTNDVAALKIVVQPNDRWQKEFAEMKRAVERGVPPMVGRMKVASVDVTGEVACVKTEA